MRLRALVLLYLLFLATASCLPVPSGADLIDEGALTGHPPITIVGDAELAASPAVIVGSGTPSQPYIIENWTIDAAGVDGISIKDTTAHLIIRNCNMTNSTRFSTNSIRLVNVSNVEVANNRLTQARSGVHVEKSDNVTVLDNRAFNVSNTGIRVFQSEDVLVDGNLVNQSWWDGIYIYGSERVTVSGNQVRDIRQNGMWGSSNEGALWYDNEVWDCESGLRIETTANATVHANVLHDNMYNLNIEGIDRADYMATVADNNTVGGKPVRQYIGASGVDVPADAGMVIFVDCDDMTVDGLDMTNVTPAVSVVHSTNISIADTDINNTIDGVLLIHSNDTEVVDSRISNSVFGVEFFENNHNVDISRNDFLNVTNGAVFMWLSSSVLNGVNVNIGNNTIKDGARILTKGKNMTIAWNVIDGSYGGLEARGPYSVAHVHNNTITNTTNDYAIDVSAPYTWVEDNHIANTTWHSMDVAGDHTTVARNTIVNGSSAGIIAYSSTSPHHMTIINNTILNNGYDGIRLEGSSGDDSVISGNDIGGNAGQGIYNYGANRLIVTDNDIHDNGKNGIFCAGWGPLDDELLISGNRITSNGEAGLDLRNVDDVTVSGNEVTGHTASAGIYLEENADWGEIVRNLVYGNSLGIKVRQSSDNLIHDNFFNNEQDFEEDGMSLNVWYTDPVEEENVVGGPWQGGNLWSDYNGTDDDGDHLGDTMVPFGPGDMHPLIALAPEIVDLTVGTPCTGDNYTFRAWARSDWGILGTRAVIWYDSDLVDFTTVSLDPVSGNGTAGQEMEGTVQLAGNVTYLHYYIRTENRWGKENRTPEVGRQIIDNDVPVIEDLTGQPYAGHGLALTAIITDNIMMYNASVDHWFDDGLPVKVPLPGLGPVYDTVVQVPADALVLHYRFHALDMDGLNASSPVISKAVLDGDGPVLSDDSGTPTTGDMFMFNISITDAGNISYFNISYRFDNGDPVSIMSGDTPGAQVPAAAYVMEYNVTVMDGAGNAAYLNRTVQVVDNDAPAAVLEIGELESGMSGTVTAEITDNRDGVLKAVLTYEQPYQNSTADMAQMSGDNYAAEILVSSVSRNVTGNLTVYDRAGNNASYPFLQPVKDIIAPRVYIMPGYPTTGDVFQVMADMNDNFGITKAVLGYEWDGSAAPVEFDFNGNGAIVVPDSATFLVLTVQAWDAAGNSDGHSINLSVVDNDGPVLYDMTDDAPRKGGSFTFRARAVDNFGTGSVVLHWYWDEGVVKEVPMELSGGIYTASVKIPSGAGNVTYYYTATDVNGNKGTSALWTVDTEGSGPVVTEDGLIYPVAAIALIAIVLAIIFIYRDTARQRERIRRKGEDVEEEEDEEDGEGDEELEDEDEELEEDGDEEETDFEELEEE